MNSAARPSQHREGLERGDRGGSETTVTGGAPLSPHNRPVLSSISIRIPRSARFRRHRRQTARRRTSRARHRPVSSRRSPRRRVPRRARCRQDRIDVGKPRRKNAEGSLVVGAGPLHDIGHGQGDVAGPQRISHGPPFPLKRSIEGGRVVDLDDRTGRELIPLDVGDRRTWEIQARLSVGEYLPIKARPAEINGSISIVIQLNARRRGAE